MTNREKKENYDENTEGAVGKWRWQRRGHSAHIFSWLHHTFDVAQPVGHWQCNIMKQNARLELWFKF